MMTRYSISNPIHKMSVRGSISLLGRAMITVGLVLLLFVAYQLWGTNLIEARSQNKLRSEFRDRLEKVDLKNTTTTTTAPGDDDTDSPAIDTPTDAELAQLSQETKAGEPIAIIKIPKLGVDHVVVSGTSKSDLQKGPGHYPATPLPGQQGNVAIAGHRTTYGAPFNRLDELVKGDEIILETARGTFTYRVSQDNKIVSPSDVSVINPTQDKNDPKKLLAELTLTTCHPKYSAAKRLIIRAELDPSQAKGAKQASQLLDKSGKLPTTIDIGSADDTAGGAGIGHSNILVAIGVASFHLPLLWWLLLFVTVGFIWWWLFHRFHNWKVWIAGVLPFVFVMLIYFVNLEHVLPSNI